MTQAICRHEQAEAGTGRAWGGAWSQRSRAVAFWLMLVPGDLRYSTDHEWAAIDGTSVRIGVTDYAQDALGDVVFVQLPDVGSAFALGGSFGEVESTKSVSDIYAPVSGTVREVNLRLADEPQLVNSDPYGDGWLCVIEMDEPSQLDHLLDAEAYSALTES